MSNVRDFGAVGDGEVDDTQAILHALKDGDGVLDFPRGVYRLTQTVEVPLGEVGPAGVSGSAGTAKLRMTGPGPALRFVGRHEGTGDPNSFNPTVWQSERLPTVRDIEIEGGHPEADGIELVGTVQATIQGVLIRQVRHGIHLLRRNRNVLIANSHVYHNRGVGIFLDRLNLHQINIVGCHISYNRLGGIRIEGSEIRNLQITGNDIEYNNHRAHGAAPEPTAEIYVDTTAEGASVAEVAICSNTIQATASPGGANIRVVGDLSQRNPPGLWTISGNIIGSQENNVHLVGCQGVTLSGNVIYSAANRNLLVERSREITVGGCTFRRHTPEYGTGVRFVECEDSVLHGCTFRDASEEGQASGASLLELMKCQRIDVVGCQFFDGIPFGIDARDCRSVSVSQCTIAETRRRHSGAVRFAGEGNGNWLHGCRISVPDVRKLAFTDPPPADAQAAQASILTVGENLYEDPLKGE